MPFACDSYAEADIKAILSCAWFFPAAVRLTPCPLGFA
jgi:hypothetical protein